MKQFKYIFVFGLIFFSFAYVKANKSKKVFYKAPKDFLVETNFFPAFFPTTYTHTGVEKIMVMIPPEMKSKLGIPKTATGELNSQFLKGKQNFNQQFGIKDWILEKYNFSNSAYGEKLELNGSYTSIAGVKTNFIEHYYFSDSAIQTIHLFYPSKSKGNVVEQAKQSLQTFNPNIN